MSLCSLKYDESVTSHFCILSFWLLRVQAAVSPRAYPPPSTSPGDTAAVATTTTTVPWITGAWSRITRAEIIQECVQNYQKRVSYDKKKLYVFSYATKSSSDIAMQTSWAAGVTEQGHRVWLIMWGGGSEGNVIYIGAPASHTLLRPL